MAGTVPAAYLGPHMLAGLRRAAAQRRQLTGRREGERATSPPLSHTHGSAGAASRAAMATPLEHWWW